MKDEVKLSEDFTRRGSLEDLGRWYVTAYVRDAARAMPAGTRLLDAGAGECAYKRFFGHCAYTAVDLAVGDTGWNYINLDVIAPLHRLPIAEASFDAVLCTQVLEHLERPAESLAEIHRVLRSGGRLYLTAPMAHPEHQVPYDFYRYTSFGLRSLIGGAGFREIEVEPFGGLFVRWAYELPRIFTFFPPAGIRARRPSAAGILLLPVRLLCSILIPALQRLLLFLDRFDSKRDDPFGWSVTATK
ncbi:MAG TPA: class I SAM-dependent methyltransferase [Thermoanaerobaculia bacterium]